MRMEAYGCIRMHIGCIRKHTDAYGVFVLSVRGFGALGFRYLGLQFCNTGEYNDQFQTNPDFFRDVPFIYQILYNWSDSDRVCAPEHIIEMSNSYIF